MSTGFSDLYVVGGGVYGTYSPTDDRAYEARPCARCNGNQVVSLAYSHDGTQQWFRCANCNLAMARNDSEVSPSVAPLRSPDGMPDVERKAWTEVRSCLAVGADTAAVMLCRKMILHVAVGAGLPARSDNGQSPSFGRSVAHLQEQGHITPPMRLWVDRIKDVGNEANHELQGIPTAVALDVAEFTLQLLVLMYELPARMNAALPTVEQTPIAEPSGD